MVIEVGLDYFCVYYFMGMYLFYMFVMYGGGLECVVFYLEKVVEWFESYEFVLLMYLAWGGYFNK